ncbi:MAG: tyrosine-protein phosphatase [Planctomycetes bacterium]|nr:tyrosine-protein phosphatase [Planctomycetota bacterium]
MRTAAMLLLSTLGACTGFREGAPELFRSPQPSEELLIQRIEDHGIRSVVSMRGGGSARLTERAARVAGARHYQVSISAKRPPPPDALLALWRIAERAPRPLLVHCRAGVDRTGLAMALFVLHDTGELEQARAQLAFVPYGHLRAFGTEEMDRVLDSYAPFHGVMTFPDWVQRVYRDEYRARTDDDGR